MSRSSERSGTNNGYKDEESTWEKPMQLELTGKEADVGKGHTKTEDDSQNLHGNLEWEKSTKPQSNCFVLLDIVACLISFVALVLVLLMLTGEIGKRCDCFANEGAESMATNSAKITSSEENMTSMLNSLLNLKSTTYQVKADLEAVKNGLATLNSTATKANIELRALENDFNQSKAHLMETDTKTRETLTAVNSTFTREIEKLNFTLNQLNSGIQTTNSGIAELSDDVMKLPCCSNPCKNGGTCYPANVTCKFICACAPGFVGKVCERAAESCKELHDHNKTDGNKAYPLKLGSVTLPIFCQMTSLGACGDGGWTLVIKMDGSKDTFHYDSEIWSNMTAYNATAGMTGFDKLESKLPTYWDTSFTKICLGIKNGQQINFILLDKVAESMYSLIADGQYRPTSLGRGTWKTLVGYDASLQLHCNKEGFNAYTVSGRPKARIGILGNEQNDCSSCDSRIGFGTGGYPDDSNTCGNVAQHGGDNGDRHIKAMGYIFIQ